MLSDLRTAIRFMQMFLDIFKIIYKLVNFEGLKILERGGAVAAAPRE